MILVIWHQLVFKKGDLNNSANPNGILLTEDRSQYKKTPLQVDNQIFKAGNIG